MATGQATSSDTITESRPYYETLVDVITYARREGLYTLAAFINATRFDENHDAIYEAWQNRLGPSGGDTFGVLNHIHAEREAAEARVAARIRQQEEELLSP